MTHRRDKLRKVKAAAAAVRFAESETVQAYQRAAAADRIASIVAHNAKT